MAQLCSSSSEFISTTAGNKAGKEEEKCGLHNLSSACDILLLLFFFPIPDFSSPLVSRSPFCFLLQLVDTVLPSSRPSSVLAFVLTASRGIVACRSLSKTSHTRCSESHELKFVQASRKDVQLPGLHCTPSPSVH